MYMGKKKLLVGMFCFVYVVISEYNNNLHTKQQDLC